MTVAGRETDRVSGCVFVFLDQAAEEVGAVELRIGWRAKRDRVSVCLLGWTKCKRAVRPMAVVVVGVGAEDVFELAAAEDEQPVEALASDASRVKKVGSGFQPVIRAAAAA